MAFVCPPPDVARSGGAELRGLSANQLLPLPPLTLRAQTSPGPTEHGASSGEAEPGTTSRKSPSLNQMPSWGEGLDNAAASIWPRRSARIAPETSSPLQGVSVGEPLDEGEEVEEGGEEERFTGLPPRGPPGERGREMIAARDQGNSPVETAPTEIGHKS